MLDAPQLVPTQARVCIQDPAMIVDRVTLDALSAFPAQLEAHYAAIPAQLKHWAPASWEDVPSEPFTAIE